MAGINALTGKALSGADHILQCVEKLLTTAQSERCMREWVGNPGLRIIGKNATESEVLLWFNTVYALLSLFEPRLTITSFGFESVSRIGDLTFSMEATFNYLPLENYEQQRFLITVENGQATLSEI